MKTSSFFLASGLFLLIFLSSCGSDTQYKAFTGNIANLPILASNYEYAVWVTENSNTRLMGTLNPIEGNAQFSFAPSSDNIKDASNVFVTIENALDNYFDPSDRKILNASFGTSDQANFTSTSIASDFNGIAGTYILDSPTTTSASVDNTGIWFMKADLTQGLQLPVLNDGWKYEGWVYFNSLPISTGKFTDPGLADELNQYGGNEPPYPFPGEDFNKNAPAGLTFPANLKSKHIRITVEPNPDDSPNPFGIALLLDTVPNPPIVKTNINMSVAQNAFASGVIQKEKE